MKKNLYAFGTSLYIQFDHKLENKIIEEIIKKIYSFDDEISLFKKDSIVTNGSLSSFQTRFSDGISKLKTVNNYCTSH